MNHLDGGLPMFVNFYSENTKFRELKRVLLKRVSSETGCNVILRLPGRVIGYAGIDVTEDNKHQ